jgi:hypothetical protein
LAARPPARIIGRSCGRFIDDDQVAVFSHPGQVNLEQLAQVSAQQADRRSAGLRFGRAAFPFLRQNTTAHPHQRQQIFDQIGRPATARATAQSYRSRYFLSWPTSSARACTTSTRSSPKHPTTCRQNSAFLPTDSTSVSVERRVENLERNAREAGPGANVDQAGRRVISPGQQAGQRVEEMLGAHALHIADSGQVELFIPIQQLLFVALKARQLPLR